MGSVTIARFHDSILGTLDCTPCRKAHDLEVMDFVSHRLSWGLKGKMHVSFHWLLGHRVAILGSIEYAYGCRSRKEKFPVSNQILFFYSHGCTHLLRRHILKRSWLENPSMTVMFFSETICLKISGIKVLRVVPSVWSFY